MPCGANNFPQKFEDAAKSFLQSKWLMEPPSWHSASTVQMKMEKEINI